MTKEADTIETAEVEKIAFSPEEIMTTDELPMTDLVIVEEPPAVKKDYTETQDLGDFMEWITGKMNNLPPHSGKTTAGCERVIAHLKMLDKEISKAIARDVDCKLDDQAVEKFRKDIRKMIKKLDKRHKEINDAYDADDDKFAVSENNAIVKEADAVWSCPKCHKEVTPGDEEHIERHKAMCVANEANDKTALGPKDNVKASACACHIEAKADDNCPTCKIKLWKAAEGLYECISCEAVFERPLTKEAGTSRIQLVMDPFQRAITGIIVNAVVSQGKNAEEAYAELKKQYKFSERDELGIQQLLMDMGYPIARNFMSASHNNIEFSTNYSA